MHCGTARPKFCFDQVAKTTPGRAGPADRLSESLKNSLENAVPYGLSRPKRASGWWAGNTGVAGRKRANKIPWYGPEAWIRRKRKF